MNNKGKVLLASGFLAGSLLFSAGPAAARDYWHWSGTHNRWEHNAQIRSDQEDLNRARRELESDRAHHANRRTIAQDEARIRDLERDLHQDVRESRR
jgi:hypothetical protein